MVFGYLALVAADFAGGRSFRCNEFQPCAKKGSGKCSNKWNTKKD